MFIQRLERKCKDVQVSLTIINLLAFSVYILITFLRRFTALIFTLIALSAKTSAQTVSCENIGYENWTHANRQKTCYIKITTTITTPTTSITAPTESVLGLSLWENKKISYLPVKVAESFPELLVYGAAGCSVTRISKENFINLRRMKRLDLSNNQIALVPNNAFEDLVALEWLQLRKIQL